MIRLRIYKLTGLNTSFLPDSFISVISDDYRCSSKVKFSRPQFIGEGRYLELNNIQSLWDIFKVFESSGFKLRTEKVRDQKPLSVGRDFDLQEQTFYPFYYGQSITSILLIYSVTYVTLTVKSTSYLHERRNGSESRLLHECRCMNNKYEYFLRISCGLIL